jgi:hypothetical protein
LEEEQEEYLESEEYSRFWILKRLKLSTGLNSGKVSMILELEWRKETSILYSVFLTPIEMEESITRSSFEKSLER